MTEMTEADAAERENLWEKEMLQIYDDAAAIGYEASGFRRVGGKSGPAEGGRVCTASSDLLLPTHSLS